MTFPRVIETGSGSLRYRLTIEGFPYEFVSHPAMVGAPSFEGSRNLLPEVPSWWGAYTPILPGQPDPFGGTDAVTITDDSTVSTEFSMLLPTGGYAYPSGSPVAGSIWIKKQSTVFAQVAVTFDNFIRGALWINPDNGAVHGGSNAHLFTSYSVVEEVSGWWKLTFTHAGWVGASFVSFLVYPAGGDIASFPTSSPAVTGSSTFYAPRLYLPNGRERIDGLSCDGVRLSQNADLVNARIDANGASFKITDVGGRVTEAFSTSPTAETWLAADVSESDALFTVKSTVPFGPDGTYVYLWIDSEVVRARVGDHEQFDNIERGVWDTVAQAHYTPDGALRRYPSVTNGPTILDGRRVRLYAYGPGDPATGDGHPAWLGILVGEPRFEGPTWTLLVDPISRVLEQEVGADFGEPVPPRGVYIPTGVGNDHSAGIKLRVMRTSSTTTTAGVPPSEHYATEVVHTQIGPGFWETQEDFIEYMNGSTGPFAIVNGLPWNTSISVEASDDGSWHFVYHVHGDHDGTADAIRIETYDIAEGQHAEPHFGSKSIVQPGDSTAYDARFVTWTMTINNSYRQFAAPEDCVPGAGIAPRGVFIAEPSDRIVRTDATTWRDRLWPGGASAISASTTAVRISWDDDADAKEVTYSVARSSASLRYLDLVPPPRDDEAAPWRRIRHVFTAANLPEITFGRKYNTEAYAGTGTYDLLKTIEGLVPADLNLGAVPMLQSGDWNSAEWLAAYGDVLPLGAFRGYTSFEAAKLADLVAPDLQLAGLYLAFDEDGRLTVRKLRLAAATEPTTYRITPSNLLTDEGFPQYDPGAAGQFIAFAVQDGYDPTTGEYLNPPIVVYDTAARGRNPSGRIIRVEPKSTTDSDAGYDEIVTVADRVLGIFGGPYAYVTLAVPLTAFRVVLGATISITTAHLPSALGTRGVSQLVGLVTSRELDLSGGRITLTALVSTARLAGYAPSARLSSITSLGSNTYSATLQTDVLAAGDSWENHFVSGDRVKVYRYDSTNAGEVQGSIVSISGTTVTVALSSSLTVGSDEWVLTHADADSGSDTTNQRRYAVQAGADALIDWTSGASAARQFAP